MSPGRLFPLWGLCVLACGVRSGDPVVHLEDVGADAEGGSAGADPAEAGSGGSGPSGAEPPSWDGPAGLCAACETTSECGDVNDACIRHGASNFCGRDCDEGYGCPDGYSCVDLDNSRLRQCVPDDECPDYAPIPPSLDDLRAYLLVRINAERAAEELVPLQPSSCLNDLAQQSAVDYARTDEPLGKFVKDCDPVWPNCACGWGAEAEAAVAHYGLSWRGAVDRILGNYRSSDDERFVQSFLNDDFVEVGIGFWISGDEAWMALSYR